MAEEPVPALVATPHEAQKTVLDQTLRSKRQGVNVARNFTVELHAIEQAVPVGPFINTISPQIRRLVKRRTATFLPRLTKPECQRYI
jgi:hypothetical protein